MARTWQTDPDIWRTKLINMKLVEPVEGTPDEWRNTALGNEVSVDVMKVFLGVWAPTEVAYVLRRNNLMSEEEMHEIWLAKTPANAPRICCLRTSAGFSANISKFPLS